MRWYIQFIGLVNFHKNHISRSVEQQTKYDNLAAMFGQKQNLEKWKNKKQRKQKGKKEAGC